MFLSWFFLSPLRMFFGLLGMLLLALLIIAAVSITAIVALNAISPGAVSDTRVIGAAA